MSIAFMNHPPFSKLLLAFLYQLNYKTTMYPLEGRKLSMLTQSGRPQLMQAIQHYQQINMINCNQVKVSMLDQRNILQLLSKGSQIRYCTRYYSNLYPIWRELLLRFNIVLLQIWNCKILRLLLRIQMICIYKLRLLWSFCKHTKLE